MIAGVISLAALIVVVVSLVWLHRQPTGLSAVRNAVSQYGITRFRAGYRVATLAFALGGLALAVGIGIAFGGGVRSSVITPLILFAAARALISWFPMDAPGVTRTGTGTMHGLLAVIAFASIAYAAVRFGGFLIHHARWHALAPASTALGWVMVASLLVMSLARSYPAIRARFGAVERVFYACAIIWAMLFAFACAVNLG